MDDNEYIDYRGLTKKFGFKQGTAYALVHQRRIPHVRLSKRLVLFRVKDIEAWITSHAVQERSERKARP